ncbi:MAG TPA: O-antigen ligase family protein [Oligoflexia bacterium]|nr:O-antigen ligase family protein [Oligoflexia bacterium]HMP48306.1 O-antigen ligase family protein [Oligoflexia bacterium]
MDKGRTRLRQKITPSSRGYESRSDSDSPTDHGEYISEIIEVSDPTKGSLGESAVNGESRVDSQTVFPSIWSGDFWGKVKTDPVLHSLFLFVGVLFVLPFMFGGRSDVASSAIRLLFFSYFSFRLIGSCLTYFLKPKSSTYSDSENFSGSKQFGIFRYSSSNRYFFLFLPFLCYLVFQLVPLPYSVLSFLSPLVTDSYVLSGAFFPDSLSENSEIPLTSYSGFAPLSIDPSATLDGFFWVFLFVLLGAELLGPSFWQVELSFRKRPASSRRSAGKKDTSSDFGASNRRFDFLSEVLHRVLVYVGVLLSLVTIVHLVSGAESLFGYFTPDIYIQGHSRAHWPFVSPNHLATVLGVGLLLSFVRILRESQFKTLRVESRIENQSTLKMLFKVFSEWEQRGSQFFMFFVILLGLLLTGSRASIFISMVFISILWVVYRYDRVRLVSNRLSYQGARSMIIGSRRSRGGEAKSGKIYFMLKTALFPVFLLLLGFFFLGDSSRNQLASRIGQSVEQGIDNGRKELNEISLKVISDYPVWGVGLNSWNQVAPQYASSELAIYDLDYAHNEFLQFFSELGAVGVFCLLLPVSFILFSLRLKSGIREMHPIRRFYLLGVFFAFLLPVFHASVDFPFHMPAVSLISLATFVIFARTARGFFFEEDGETSSRLLH